ncbi:hypothetical protein [Nostoc sp.]
MRTWVYQKLRYSRISLGGDRIFIVNFGVKITTIENNTAVGINDERSPRF